jgi:hypothetical protein
MRYGIGGFRWRGLLLGIAHHLSFLALLHFKWVAARA